MNNNAPIGVSAGDRKSGDREKDSNEKYVILQKKNDFEMRMRYLSKLTYHQVWLAPSKQKKSH